MDSEIERESASTERTLVEEDDAQPGEATELERGVCIGRYVALHRLGSGGMGVVWAAWDPELDREVAIKVLGRRFRRGGKARGRLLREAQAMARLDHPNILAVHDVGVFDNQVFVAMELVRGQTLREWLAAEERTPDAIIEVYRQAALGLAAAHEVGLVHRDFKPDNAMIDGRGRVRVMDFGLAAAYGKLDESLDPEGEPWVDDERLDSGLSTSGSVNDLVRSGLSGERELDRSTDLLATPLTEVGALIGTPAYMGPEQIAGGRGGPASDQFALCVALWQALFGERPYPGDTLSELWIAFEARDLRKPAEGVAVPKSVVAALSRGLAVAPSERWPTMDALALALEPAPPGRGPYLALALAALALILGFVGLDLLLDSRRAEACSQQSPHFVEVWDQQRRTAVEDRLRGAGAHGDETWARVEVALEAWIDDWMRVQAAACVEEGRGEGSLPESVRIARAVCLEQAKTALAATVDVLAEADADVTARALDMVVDLPDPSACSQVERLVARAERALDEPQLRAAEADLARIRALREAGRLREAIAAIVDLRAELGEGLEPGLELALVEVRGLAELELDRHEDALETLVRGYTLAVELGDDERAARLARALILAHQGRGQTEQARAWNVHAAAFERRVGWGEAERGQRLVALATVADGAGEYDEALETFAEAAALLERAHGPDSLPLARMLDEYGATYSRVSRLDEAVAALERSLGIVEAALGSTHPEAGAAHLELGNTAYRMGELDAAKVHFERTIAIVEPSLGAAHSLVTGALTGLGAVALAEARDADAAAHFRSSIERIEAGAGPESPRLAPPLVNLGIALKRGEDFAGAEASQRRALELLESIHGPEHPNLLAVLDNLGELATLRDHAGDARAYYERSLKIGEQRFGAEHPELDYALAGLGAALVALGEPDQARAYYERILAGREVEGKLPVMLADALFALAKLDLDAGRRDDAVVRGREASELYGQASGVGSAGQATVDTWLDGL